MTPDASTTAIAIAGMAAITYAIRAGGLVVARGRDYSDVSPTRGVFNGGGAQTLYLGVTVEPEQLSAP